MDMNGSSAIVTGGASGLGEATVRKLASKGVRCTIFDRNEPLAKELAAELGGGANYVAGDVTVPDDCQRAVDQAAEGGNLRIAVNCAGVGWVGRVINRDGSPHDFGAFEMIQKINLFGTFNVMTKAAS
ncbi:MAG: SDR family NAD(P)-dependent oxidoreductase, partial [Actinobacteria bacterium]|nr:SDR family NAD(P)-dependent oxidoreductase [Actinomycetota bacterium]